MKKKGKQLLSLLLALAIVLCTAVGASAKTVEYEGDLLEDLAIIGMQPADGEYKMYQDLSYGKKAVNKYDLYIPTDIDKSKAQSVILIIHGGGFNSGSKEDESYRAEYLATRGYLVANMDITIFQHISFNSLNGTVDWDDGYDPVETANKDSMVQMDKDIYNCVRYIKYHCRKKGIKVTGMATFGSSAGGALSLMYSYRHVKDSPIPIKCVYAFKAPTSFHAEDWGFTEEEDVRRWDSAVLGRIVSKKEVRNGTADKEIAALSPVDLVSSKQKPTLFAHGSWDLVVPVEQSLRLKTRLDKKGVMNDFLYFKYCTHITSEIGGDPEKWVEYWHLFDHYADLYL